VNAVLATRPHVEFEGVVRTPAEIVAGLQQLVTLRADTEAAKATYEKAVASENAARPALLELMSGLVEFVRTTFGNDAPTLNAFGLAPKKKRAPQTVEEKAAAVAKREATRAARHTMGPKAKLAVKGNVVGVEVTPMIEPPPQAETTAQTPTLTVPTPQVAPKRAEPAA
jgi:hypothetical protein